MGCGGGAGFLECPLKRIALEAMKVAGEKTAAVFLEKWPDLFVVGSGDVEFSYFVHGKKSKFALLAGGGDVVQAG